MLLPSDIDFNVELDTEMQTSNTFAIDFNRQRIGGFIDQQTALKQSLMCRILTERYQYLIYDQQYGCSANDFIIGDYPEELVEVELPRELTETVLADERVLAVKGISMSFERDSAYVSMILDTIFGEVAISDLNLKGGNN